MKKVALVIEVLSKGSARFDRGVKRELFQRNGVGEYWIVDLEARAVEIWTPEAAAPVLATSQLDWRAAGRDAAFTLALPPFFTECLGAPEV